MISRPVRCAIVGMGARGRAFARRLAPWPEAEVAWLVERSADRLEAARSLAPAARETADLDEALADAALDAVLIATPDWLHAGQAIAALTAGKHVLLEKPLALGIADARAVLAARAAAGRVLRLGYVLRAAPFYAAMRKAVADGAIGRVLQARLGDDLSAAHGASYRRRWHRRAEACGGLMVHKGCHDLDLVCWLLASRPHRVASFAAADLFARPAPAPFCQQCPETAICAFVDRGAYEARTPGEAADPAAHGLGGCVFGENGDLVDRQVVAFELVSGVQGSFTLAMGSPTASDRTVTLIGEAGRIEGRFGEGRWRLTRRDGEVRAWSADQAPSGHGGGDEATLRAFLRACAEQGAVTWRAADEAEALVGLEFALAAEQARLSGRVVTLETAGRGGGSTV